MTILSKRILVEVGRSYHRDFDLHILPVTISGECWPEWSSSLSAASRSLAELLPSGVQTRAYSLQEALHWGEPYLFYPVTGLASWVVAMVDQHTVRGGLLGGEVRHQAKGLEESVQGLVDQGVAMSAARLYVARLPIWSAARIREAAMTLEKTFYQISGWKPRLLEENRIKAVQQRQIAEAIEHQKKNGQTVYPIDKERMLLSLIRTGDQNGARRVLNEMLGAMYLFSPKLAVLRARAIEMMGYLTRAAVEDSPLMEPLIERNHQWMQQLVSASDFETLSHVLMQALDDFMQGIYAHGFNVYNPKVSRILDFIAQHYTKPVTLAQIAEATNLSVFRVSHLVKQCTGKSILQHIMQLRIQKARQMLERSSLSCSEIAYELGFCDQSYFIKHFKRLTGTTPRRYCRSTAVPGPSHIAPAVE
ncbi:MAG: AraC family transcriptional regulator [Kiritimatiellae bacterium]|nr:AraC family transcriptional regulator [Kiritimatiellia bacterium]